MRMPGFTADSVLRARLSSGTGVENLSGMCIWKRTCVPLIACEGNVCWVVRLVCTYSVTCYG
jgi:hypothetical protein